MKLRIWLLSALLAVSSANALAAAQDDALALVQLEENWFAATKAHDLVMLDAILDDNYVADMLGQKRNKQELLRSPTPAFNQTLVHPRVKVEGDKATVFGVNLVTFSNGTSRRVDFADEFVRKDGRWRAIRSWFTD